MNEMVNTIANDETEKENKNMNKLCNTFLCDMETAEFLRQMANAYGIPKAAYVRKVLEEDMERKKDILPKLNKIKDLQAEIRQMEEERKKLEALVTEMAAKMKELKELQDEVGVA